MGSFFFIFKHVARNSCCFPVISKCVAYVLLALTTLSLVVIGNAAGQKQDIQPAHNDAATTPEGSGKSVTNNDLDNSIEAAKAALAADELSYGPSDPAIVHSLIQLASALDREKRHNESERHLTRALKILESIKEEPPAAELAQCLSQLATSRRLQGKFSKTEEYYRRANDLFKSEADYVSFARNLSELGVLYSTQGRTIDAERLFRYVLRIQQAETETHDEDIAATLIRLANICLQRERDADATQFVEQALAIVDKTGAARSMVVAEELDRLALQYVEQDEPAAATPLIERSLSVRQKILSDDNWYLGESFNNAGIVRASNGDYTGAKEAYLKSLEVKRRALEANDSRLLGTLDNLAVAYQQLGEYHEADNVFRDVLASKESLFGRESIEVAFTLSNLASLRCIQKRYGEAEEMYDRALRMLEKAGAPKVPFQVAVMEKLADVYNKNGKGEEAKVLRNRAQEFHKSQPN